MCRRVRRAAAASRPRAVAERRASCTHTPAWRPESLKSSKGQFRGSKAPRYLKCSKGSGSLHMSKSAKIPKMSRSPGLHLPPSSPRVHNCSMQAARFTHVCFANACVVRFRKIFRVTPRVWQSPGPSICQ
eukprot:7329293-Prymnesium_polylepis.1